ncbi:MAG: IclR family transcriptional regulator [Candidatus Promineifilaceae bacterium]|nr:IclR family transcriptional regulator [Candidatus Promineifilaceae bacterium]
MIDRDTRYFIEALHRGLRVLEAFSEDRSSLSLKEIADSVELDKSTAFRFTYTLEQLGYLERDPESKRYRPGLKALRLGFTALNSLEISQLARPYLKELCDESQETVNLAVRDGSEIVYVERLSPHQIVNINLQVGSRLPTYCTSIGKVLLAELDDEEVLQLLGPGPYDALTEHTITSYDDLLADLKRIRQRGYAIGDEELALGLRSVAAPIRTANGEPTAGINVSVSSARVSREELEVQFPPMVVRVAKRIHQALTP